jgi:hypothetical protein
MTIKYLAGNVITGLSSDTKPTNVVSPSYFYETDTHDDFVYNGSSWVKWIADDKTEILQNKTIFAKDQTSIVGILQQPSIKRHGNAWNVGGGLIVNGVWASAIESGTRTVSALDSTNGIYSNWASSSTANSKAGMTTSGPLVFTNRSFNPRMKWKFSQPSAGNSRMTCGFSSNTTVPITDTLLANGDSGVIFGFKGSDANYMVYNNDGGGAMVSNNSGIAVDTAIRTAEIVFDNSVPNCKVYMNDSLLVTLTSRIPAATTGLIMWLMLQNPSTGATNYRLYYAEFEDKIG